MWQVMTADSWASGIVRPLIYQYDRIIPGPIFFISYTFIAGIIMTNVVVAILLEKYLECTSKAAEEKAKKKEEKARAKALKDKQMGKEPKVHGSKHNKHNEHHEAATQKEGPRNPKMQGANKKAASHAPAPAGAGAGAGADLSQVLKLLAGLAHEMETLGDEVREVKKWQLEHNGTIGASDI